MKKKYAASSALLFLGAILFFSFNNCTRMVFDDSKSSRFEDLRSQNTHVGNPLTASAKTLLSQICTVISRCHPQVSSSQCETDVRSVSNVDYQLGLQPGSVATFNDIIQAESSGSIFANQAASLSCLSAVENLSCSDPVVQSAYNGSSQNPYSGVPNMIPTAPGSCPAVFNQPLARKEYFVATNGSDSNDGSSERPWATLTHASKTLVLGDEGAIVHVAPGIYSPALDNTCPEGQSPCAIFTTRSGTASAPLIYISDQQWGAQIAPSSGASTLWYNTGDYVKIIGFEMIGTAETNWGIFGDGAFGQVIGNHIHNIPNPKGCSLSQAGGGIIFGFFSQSHDNDAIGNLIHDIGPFPGNGLAESAYCFHSDGIAYRQPGGKIYNNIIYRSGTWGINTFVSATNLQISNNLLFNNGAKSNTGKLVGGGLLISAETGSGVMNDTTVANNIVRNNSGLGIGEYDSVGTRNLYANNLLFSNNQDWLLLSGAAPVGTITEEPLMIDFRMDGSGNYRLQSTSPAIDKGTSNCAAGNGNCSPQNDYSGFNRPAPIDIGPFEWHP